MNCTPPFLRGPRALAGLALLGSVISAGCRATGEGEEIDWREAPHHVSILTASTIEENETAPSIGLDYEYRASQFLGVGAIAEYAFEDIDATTLLGVVDLHITNQFIVQTGPGIEFVEDEEEFVYRIGVLYEWEIGGGYTLSPQAHCDLTTGENALVLGLAIGRGF